MCPFHVLSIFNFTETLGLTDLHPVEMLQDQAQCILGDYVRNRYQRQPTRFGRLLLAIPLLRMIRTSTIEMFFFKETVGEASVIRLLHDMYRTSNHQTQTKPSSSSDISISRLFPPVQSLFASSQMIPTSIPLTPSAPILTTLDKSFSGLEDENISISDRNTLRRSPNNQPKTISELAAANWYNIRFLVRKHLMSIK